MVNVVYSTYNGYQATQTKCILFTAILYVYVSLCI